MEKLLTRRLIHEVPVAVPDGAGGQTRTWEVRGAHWCEIRMRSGALRPSEFGSTPRLGLRITTRAVPQDHEARPWPGHRLIDGSRRFLVEAVQESDPQGRYLTILASEVPQQEATP